jgi:uncharacterized protein
MAISVPSDHESATQAGGERTTPTKKPRAFLTAEWLNLVMLNYAADPGLLNRFVPAGTELDSFDGVTYLSLIGFEFNRTRMAGLSIPFHGSFEEVNLRFYVRRGSRRGVVFIRELVPRRAVAAIARLAFGENYACVPMSHVIRIEPGTNSISAEYSWGSGPSRCAMQLEAGEPWLLPAEGSLSQFITEHYWGYAAQPGSGCLEYEVQHPRWRVREARCARFSGDAAPVYGGEFAKVFAGLPNSAFLAEGSQVTVFKGTTIA